MKKNNIISLLFIVFALLCSVPSSASYMFKHYGVESGLSQSTVFALLQDRTGFIWVGTKSGLNRFDGIMFKVYHASSASYSLGSDIVTSLYEDGDGKIWVGTDAGIWIYNPMNDAFVPFSAKTSNGVSVRNTISAIVGNGDNIYIASHEQGVFRYNVKTRQLFNNRLQGKPNAEGISISSDGRVWIGFYGGGLYYADANLRVLKPFTLVDGTLPFEHDIVSSVVEYAPGRLFVGSAHHGLSEIDTQHNTITELVTKYSGNDIFVRQLSRKGDEIWAATEMGLYVYDVKTRGMQHFMYNPANPFSLSDNPLYCLYQDREGGMWIGSYFGGINYLPDTSQLFDRYVPQDATGRAICGRRVREIVQADDGNLWIGTEDAGLACFNPVTGDFERIEASAYFPNVHGLMADGDKLWVGTFSYGLKIIDIHSRKVVKSFVAGRAQGELRDNAIFGISKSPDGVVYIATVRGLCWYDDTNGKFEYVKEVPAILINQVKFDSSGNLWVATQADGVYLYRRRERRWHHYSKSAKCHITSNTVLAVYEDNEHRIWFPTQGGGVCRYNPSTDDIEQFTVGTNTIGSSVFEVLEDHQGMFWFTTYRGLVCFNPDNKTLRYFANTSLMMDNQFNNSSALVADDGSIYLGCLSGMLRFMPSRLAKSRSLPKLVATQLSIGNEIVNNFTEDSPLNQNIVYAHELSLSHSQNSFSLNVVPLDYSNTLGIEIEYILEGYDREWQSIRADHIIAYSNLPAGDYRLRVRMKDNGNQWSKNEYELEVTIHPHFLLSVWAKVVYLILLCGAAWMMWIRLQRRALSKREKALEQFEHEKEQELYESKIHFFTNVAHEIRTPLTLIKAPLENIINRGKVENPEVKEDLEIMYQNTNRLSDLINQLLDFRKTERDGLKLNFEQCNIQKLVSDIYERFRSIMRERGIDSSMSILCGGLNACVDHEGFIKIVSNLVNNAVKYCASTVQVVLDADDVNFTLIIKNDGNIIPTDMREKIFQPFFRLESASNTVSTTGTGIGLAMAKSLAELHGGTLMMDDDAEMNVFRLTLPIKQETMLSISVDTTLASTIKDGGMETNTIVDPTKPTLLLVEDNVQMRDYEKLRLQNDYNILTAGDGEEALRVLGSNVVNLIVSDIMMEPMNGLTLLSRVKHDATMSHIPVVLLTAVTSDCAKLESMENGADAYIVKPFSITYLAETVANLLRQREEIKKAYAQSPFVGSETVSISTTDTDFLQRLKDVVTRNIDNSDFNVDQLAAELNMSRTSLNRKIRGTLDISPNNYIRIERLKTAARLLKEGSSKVNEVCYRVGFTTPSYFTKCFYQQFGLLPKDFNKETK